MSYAIVRSAGKREQSGITGCKWLRAAEAWFKGFLPAPVNVEVLNIHKDLFLYIITMPCPEVFCLKNRIGKKRTMKKWYSIIKEKSITHYLTEKSLMEYLGEDQSHLDEDFPAESLNSKAALLFKMEPLRGIKTEALTITVTDAENRHLTTQMVSCLKNFRNVNIIEGGDRNNEFWEDFMTETGVPVCRTDDFNVLQRSDVWLSFKKIRSNPTFRGIKIDIPEKSIIFTDKQKQYRVGYTFSRDILRKLGRNLLGRFEHEMLASFLLHAMVHGEGYSLASAEEMLGFELVWS